MQWQTAGKQNLPLCIRFDRTVLAQLFQGLFCWAVMTSEGVNGAASPTTQGWPETDDLQGAVPTSSSGGGFCSLPQTWGALQKGFSPEQAVAHFRRCRALKYLLLFWQLIYSARTKAGVNFHWILADSMPAWDCTQQFFLQAGLGTCV